MTPESLENHGALNKEQKASLDSLKVKAEKEKAELGRMLPQQLESDFYDARR